MTEVEILVWPGGGDGDGRSQWIGGCVLNSIFQPQLPAVRGGSLEAPSSQFPPREARETHTRHADPQGTAASIARAGRPGFWSQLLLTSWARLETLLGLPPVPVAVRTIAVLLARCCGFPRPCCRVHRAQPQRGSELVSGTKWVLYQNLSSE